MPPNNPMTEGEALAFDRRFADMLVGILGDVQDELGFTDEEKLCANGSAEIVAAIRELKERAALTAHTAASGGEVVAWQYRYLGGTGEWTPLPAQHAKTFASFDDYEVRPLYTAPPAAVPADALTNLVERWLLHSDPYHGKCADELAALIPKGADHE